MYTEELFREIHIVVLLSSDGSLIVGPSDFPFDSSICLFGVQQHHRHQPDGRSLDHTQTKENRSPQLRTSET
jgi:hypothetical protein